MSVNAETSSENCVSKPTFVETKPTTSDEATNEFFGYHVEVNCGEDGSYKGIVTEVEPADNESYKWGKVKLEKPTRNGVPLGEQMAILIPGELIQDIKVLVMPGINPKQMTDGFIHVPAKKVTHRLGRPTIPTRHNAHKPINSKSSYETRMTGTQFLNRYGQLSTSSTFTNSNIPTSVQVLQRSKKVLSITPPPKDEEIKQNKIKQPNFDNYGRPPPEAVSSCPQQFKSTIPTPRRSVAQSLLQQQRPKASHSQSISGRQEMSGKQCFGSSNQMFFNKTVSTSNFVLGYGQLPKSRPKTILSITPPPDKDEPKNNAKEASSVQLKQQKTIVENIDEVQIQVSTNKKKVVGNREEPVLEKSEGKIKPLNKKKREGEMQKAKKKEVDAENKKEGKKKTKAERNNKEKDERNKREKEKRANKALEEKEKKRTTKRAADTVDNKNTKEETANEHKKETPKAHEEIAEQMEKLELSSVEHPMVNMLNEDQSCQQTTTALSQSISTDGDDKELDSIMPMTTDYIGSMATINSATGSYQGVVTAINPQQKTIRLEKPLLNGQPLRERFILLSSSQMHDIKILKRETGSHSQRSSASTQQNEREFNQGNVPGSVYMQSSPRPPTPQSQRRRSNPTIDANRQHISMPPTPPAQLAHQAYGDFKKFVQPQIPTPVRLRINARGSPHTTTIAGPTGIPAQDVYNGYNGYNNGFTNSDTMGALDFETLHTDFDFDRNLAMFNKSEFVKETENIFCSLDTAGNKDRNYRHNENVLMDSSRVISWTNAGSAAGGRVSRDNSAGHAGYNTPSPKAKPKRRY